MAPVTSLVVARFMRLPRRSADTWQGGVLRMPMWVDGPDGTPYRPRGAVWVSLETGLANVKLAETDSADGPLALDALFELAFKFTQTRPAAIQVAEQTLVEEIARALADPELSVTVGTDLLEVKTMVERMAAETSGAAAPAALDIKGVTVDRMRAFAVAARDFYAAAPWRHLSDEDLIHVESPTLARGPIASANAEEASPALRGRRGRTRPRGRVRPGVPSQRFSLAAATCRRRLSSDFPAPGQG